MDQERTYKWIQERLRELHSGTLAEQDLARLKEIALTDPFVADALEGFDAHPDEQHARHLHAIEQKIRQTKRERRRWLIPNLAVTAIAASVLIIIATYAVISRMEKEAEEPLLVLVSPDSLSIADSLQPEIAMEERTEVEGKEHLEDQAAGKSTILSDKPTQPMLSAKETTAAVKKDEASQPAEGTINAPAASSATAPASSAPADDRMAAEDAKEISRSNSKTTAKDLGQYANAMDPDMMQRRVTGRVVDALSGQPLAGVKLQVNYSNQYTYTDITGNFELSLPEPEAVLQATYTGMVDTNVVLKQGEENVQVGLRAADLIPQANMAGAKNKGPVSAPPDPMVQSHIDFSNYLHTNALLQLSSEPSSARRRVTVEFKVRKDNKPSDFTIIESSRDKTYDEEAIRLIKEGPGWYCPGENYPCRRQYTFYFR